MGRPQFSHNIEGHISVGISLICSVINTEDMFDKNYPWLTAISLNGNNCEEFRMLQEYIVGKLSFTVPLPDSQRLKKDEGG